MSKLRKSARNRECQVRIPDVCNFNPETTILAHLNSGGMGQKAPDLFGAFCCSDCHAWLDGGYVWHPCEEPFIYKDLCHHEGVIRTQEIWLREGLLIIK
jgi:hypothetical protein